MLTPQDLERSLPGLLQWKAPEGRSIDWSVIRAELGTDLPSDYRSLAESYPTLVIDDFLAISIPAPGAESDFVVGVHSGAEILRDLWEVDESHGYAPYPEPEGLLEWGSSPSGDQFYWRTKGSGPDSWTVVVSGRNDDWWEFPGGIVEFLVAVVSRTIPLPGLPAAFPSPTPSVKGIGPR
ncbi:hypothetical protein GCM10027074_40790 [Streptomyces deserti]